MNQKHDRKDVPSPNRTRHGEEINVANLCLAFCVREVRCQTSPSHDMRGGGNIRSKTPPSRVSEGGTASLLVVHCKI